MKFSVVTLGCKVNFCESAAITESFLKEGFEKAEENDTPDIYIINSCAVTGMSVKKARQILSRCKKENPDCVAVLCGCFPQSYPKEAGDTCADIVTGSADKSKLAETVKQYLADPARRVDIKKTPGEFDLSSAGADIDRTRAFIKIEDGCDRFCTYCIIPTARGRVRSMRVEDITKQARYCAELGHKEIVLTGINLGCYGAEYGLTLADAVKAARADGIERIRLSSLEPEMITPEIIEGFKSVKELCPHFHLSLQSGCDETLARMARRYTTGEFSDAADMLREAFPDCAITTDMIAGFPGETEEEFAQSLAFAEKMRFSKIHAFPYSIRKGTVAAERADQIVPHIKSVRVKKLNELSHRLENRFFSEHKGKIVSVLIEKKSSPDYINGFTPNYIPVRIYGGSAPRHSVIDVKIMGIGYDYCEGIQVNSHRR